MNDVRRKNLAVLIVVAAVFILIFSLTMVQLQKASRAQQAADDGQHQPE